MPSHPDQISAMMRAFGQELDYVQAAKAQYPRRIRLTYAVPEGLMLSVPIEDVGIGVEPYEVLVNPLDWNRLIEGLWLPTIERNMRPDDCDRQDHIDMAHVNALANPADAHLFGIPVVDDTPKVLG